MQETLKQKFCRQRCLTRGSQFLCQQIWCSDSEHRLSIPDAGLYNRSRIRYKRRINICDDETKLR